MEKDQELIEGFNAGYIIEKHRPELAKQLVENIDEVELPYVEGFLAGTIQFSQERELAKSKTISKLKSFAKDRISKPNKSKDDKEFEIDI